MIIRKKNFIVEELENMRGGDGTVRISHAEKTETTKNCRLMAEVTIPPGGSIGEHTHNDETEYYILTEGEGVVRDNGKDLPVAVGDIVKTGDGETHSIRNSGRVPLRMIAVIIAC